MVENTLLSTYKMCMIMYRAFSAKSDCFCHEFPGLLLAATTPEIPMLPQKSYTREIHYNRLEFFGNEGKNKSIQTTKNNCCYSHLSCSEGLLQKEFSLGSNHLSNSDMLMTKATYTVPAAANFLTVAPSLPQRKISELSPKFLYAK